MDISTLIDQRLLILLPLLYFLGEYIKITPIKRWLIPIILMSISVVISVLYLSFIIESTISVSTVINGFIQGIFIASSTVGINQFFKQVLEKRKEDNNKLNKR